MFSTKMVSNYGRLTILLKENINTTVILKMPEMHQDSPQSIGSGGGGKHALRKLGEGRSQGKKEGTGHCTQF
jgi:hypothetical protein